MSKKYGYAFLFLLLSYAARSQQPAQDCTDILYLKNGSVFTGSVVEYAPVPEGQIHFKTWNGLDLRFDAQNVKKIVQKCKDTPGTDRAPQGPRPYDFREKGWYNNTRLGLLPGLDYHGYINPGVLIQHSAGYHWNRLLGTGIGLGAEVFMPGEDVTTIPLFAEIRGYLYGKRVTPFYSAGAGWAFAGKNAVQDSWGQASTYKGGVMAQAQAGYRFGNHFTVYAGIRLQRKIRYWTSFWNNESGTDRILHRRMELGLGILF